VRRSAEVEFSEMFQATLPSLRRFGYSLSGNWADADDLAQTAYSRALQHWSRIRLEGSPEAYLRKSLLNAFIDGRRRAAVRRSFLSRTALPEPLELDDSAYAKELLASLPPRQRAALFLRFFEDRSVSQTAEILGCSEGTVKSHTSDALHNLRKRLAAAPTER
jgi:RNA polymerase sigma-70 factor (sigma-E family)